MPDGADIPVTVVPVAVRRPFRRQQALLFVLAEQLLIDSGPPRQFPDAHAIRSLT